MAYDLRDPGFLRDPAPMLARMRAEGPLVRARLPLLGPIWLTTTDAAARRLLKDTDRFPRDSRAGTGKPMDRQFWWMPRSAAPLMQNLVLRDGEDHRRLRALVDRAFARTAIDEMRPRLGQIADELLDGIDAGRPVDLVSAYARPLPFLAICELLGIPEEDRPRLKRWLSPISGPTSVARLLVAMPGIGRVMRHFREDFALVRRTDRPGLIRELVRAEEGGDRLSEDELLAMVVTLFIAGHETTVHLIADAILGLIDTPEARASLADDPARMPLAVEEFMRFFSPVLMTKAHFARDDCTFEGVAVKKGDKLSALLIAANHDPARATAPEEMRIDRRPNAHLGFGHGPHVCLGMQLARSEAQVGVTRLFARYPDLALAVPRGKVGFARRLGVRGVARLPVRLRP